MGGPRNGDRRGSGKGWGGFAGQGAQRLEGAVGTTNVPPAQTKNELDHIVAFAT